MWEQEWQVPIDSVRLSVAELLPAGVGLNADTTAFVVTAPGASLNVTLGELCGVPCAGGGFIPTKPAFEDTLTTNTSLPGDLVSATLEPGAFQASITHSFSFDPIRPDGATEPGFLVVRVSSNGVEIAADSISGATDSFPTNSMLVPDLSFPASVVTNNLDIQVVIYSPSGNGTTVDPSDSLVVTLQPTDIEISEATVNLTTATIGPETQEMEFAMDSALVNRIQRGALLIDVENDFDISGSLTMEFELPGRTIGETIALTQGTSSEVIDFTGDELQEILGSGDVTVNAYGSIGGAGGTITITPQQELVMAMQFELVVLVGGTGEEEGF